jgi:exopolysaccharide biosynthesis predicted pyruvyltransferase EpsI
MLLPHSYFDLIFLPLQSKKVHFLPNTHGNVGDDLINEATYQLFAHYQINLLSFEEADTVVFCGGANFGMKYFYINHRKQYYEKMRLSPTSKTAIILPQSIYQNGIDSAKEEVPDLVSKFYVRDKKSHEIMPKTILAPDLALGYNYEGIIKPPTHKQGVFLRTDIEARFADNYVNGGDPAKIIPQNVQAYFDLAMDYEHIYTDRLHFAISALILGRKATLLPNIYFKNKMVWETWLKDLGCAWADYPPTAKRYWISAPPILSFYMRRLGYKLRGH